MSENVTIVGMGYVGLTLAVTLARRGFNVYGVEKNADVVETLLGGKTHIFEPGVEALLDKHIDRNLFVSNEFPNKEQDVVVVCVSTPINQNTLSPDLRNIKAASEEISAHMNEFTLVVVRSTVPIGTTRNIIVPIFQRKVKWVQIAFCPERTIQGQALKELEELPQVIGGIDEKSASRAEEFFQKVSRSTVRVSPIEAAEMVKLVNNCHTDIIYGFGNEVALMAERFNLDPLEIIGAANIGYPRPDLCKPGFVGGGCLSKDPYILMNSFSNFEYVPQLVKAARELNESMPRQVALRVLVKLKGLGKENTKVKILLCGFAYKGFPVTDDMRGTPVIPVIDVFKNHSNIELYGHDYMVREEVIRDCGAIPTDVEEGFKGADAVVFLNDHPSYRKLEIEKLLQSMKQPAVIYDCWRIFNDLKLGEERSVIYGGIGYG